MHAVYTHVYIDSNICGDRTWNHMRMNVECAIATLTRLKVKYETDRTQNTRDSQDTKYIKLNYDKILNKELAELVQT